MKYRTRVHEVEAEMDIETGMMVVQDSGTTIKMMPDVFHKLYQREWGEGDGLQWRDNFVAVDIDGTVATSLLMGKYPSDYMKKKPIPGAVEALREFKRLGIPVMFFTARPEADRELTEAWLVANGFAGLYDDLVMEKPGFQVLIDDRAIGFTGDWKKAMAEVKKKLTDYGVIR